MASSVGRFLLKTIRARNPRSTTRLRTARNWSVKAQFTPVRVVHRQLRFHLDSHSRSTLSFSVPPTSSDGSVDCAQYFSQLNAQSKLAAIEMTLRPIASLFDDSNRSLWTELIDGGDDDDDGITQDQLRSFGDQLANYVTSCSSGGCATVSNSCNTGFYGSPPNCESCYGGSGALGSKGNCAKTQTCTTDGSCQGSLPPPPRSTISWDGILDRGESLYSPNGKCQLLFQDDGNLIMFLDVRGDSMVPLSRPNLLELEIGENSSQKLRAGQARQWRVS